MRFPDDRARTEAVPWIGGCTANGAIRVGSEAADVGCIAHVREQARLECGPPWAERSETAAHLDAEFFSNAGEAKIAIE